MRLRGQLNPGEYVIAATRPRLNREVSTPD